MGKVKDKILMISLYDVFMEAIDKDAYIEIWTSARRYHHFHSADIEVVNVAIIQYIQVDNGVTHTHTIPLDSIDNVIYHTQ